MKYYLHDTNAFQDEKITELYIKFGYEGIGLYFTILEKLALQEKPIKTVVLKKQLNVKKRLNKCWSFIEELDLISSNNGETFSKFLDDFFTHKKKPYRYIPRKIRKAVFKKYNYTCANCGSKKNLEIDHIIPVSKQGSNEFENLQVLCKTCNLKKSNKI